MTNTIDRGLRRMDDILERMNQNHKDDRDIYKMLCLMDDKTLLAVSVNADHIILERMKDSKTPEVNKGFFDKLKKNSREV